MVSHAAPKPELKHLPRTAETGLALSKGLDRAPAVDADPAADGGLDDWALDRHRSAKCSACYSEQQGSPNFVKDEAQYLQTDRPCPPLLAKHRNESEPG